MRLHTVLALGGAALALAVRAEAAPTVSLTATSSVSGDSLSLSPTLTANPDGSFSTSGSATKPSFSLVFSLQLRADPSLVGSFTLQNLSSSTQFFSVSATMTVPPVGAPTRMGGYYGDVTYTDTGGGDGSVTVATNGIDPFYRAQIDGVTVQSLGSFNLTAFGGPGAFGTISQQTWGTPIPSAAGPGVAGSIGVSFPAFSVTPGDTISVPFEFVVNAPEPSFASLFATGGTLILLATARRKLFHRA